MISRYASKEMTAIWSDENRFRIWQEIETVVCEVRADRGEIPKDAAVEIRAKGDFKPGSDIDLTLHGENLTNARLRDIAEVLDDLLLPYTIDLSLYAELDHAELRKHIERVGQQFYAKPQ